MTRRLVLDLLILYVLALLLGLWVGALFAAESCPGVVLTSGTVTSAEHELQEGYFVINETTVKVHPHGLAVTELLAARGQIRELVLRPVRCRELQRVIR